MKIKKSEIFELEKELIEEYYPRMEPRPIKIDSENKFSENKFAGRAGRRNLEISRDFLKECTKEELIETIKHELIHYSLPGHGHDDKFLNECKRLNLKLPDNAYEYHRFIEEQTFMGRIEEIVEKDGSITIIHKKKPQWNLFKDSVLENATHQGECFKLLRKTVGISQRELAEKAGLSLNMLRRIEKTEDLFCINQFPCTNPFDEKDLKMLFYAVFKLKPLK